MSPQKLKLPETIKVKVSTTDEGCFFAELPEYECFTEAGSMDELQHMINDLIYEILEVPKKIQGKVRYLPQTKPERSRFFTVMTTPDIFRANVIGNVS